MIYANSVHGSFIRRLLSVPGSFTVLFSIAARLVSVWSIPQGKPSTETRKSPHSCGDMSPGSLFHAYRMLRLWDDITPSDPLRMFVHVLCLRPAFPLISQTQCMSWVAEFQVCSKEVLGAALLTVAIAQRVCLTGSSIHSCCFLNQKQQVISLLRFAPFLSHFYVIFTPLCSACSLFPLPALFRIVPVDLATPAHELSLALRPAQIPYVFDMYRLISAFNKQHSS